MRRRRVAGVGLLALTLTASASCAGQASAGPASPATLASPAGVDRRGPDVSKVIAPAGGVFSQQSAWGLKVAGAKLAPNSAAQIAGLVEQVQSVYGGVAAFNAHSYDTSFVIAGKNTPTTNVHYVDCQNKGYEPSGLAGQFANVPVPDGAVPSSGTDSEMTVYQPSTDRLWELWIMRKTSTGWSSCFGGRIDHVSTSPGYFGGGFGASASGLATAGGMVGLADVRSGVISHALALAIISPAISTRVSWPAQRSDGGSTDADAIPEGTRLRLDPTVNVNKLPGLNPVARMVAKAAQTYGFVVTDTSGAVAVDAESPAAEQAITGTDPWTALKDNVPDYLVMQNFPWQDLQALPNNWGEPRR